MKWYVGAQDGYGKWFLLTVAFMRIPEGKPTRHNRWTTRLDDAAEFDSIEEAHEGFSRIARKMGEYWEMGDNTLEGSNGFQDFRSIPADEIMNYLVAQELTG